MFIPFMQGRHDAEVFARYRHPGGFMLPQRNTILHYSTSNAKRFGGIIESSQCGTSKCVTSSTKFRKREVFPNW
jgi:hypothetical protein